jgi:hypothetical protein
MTLTDLFAHEPEAVAGRGNGKPAKAKKRKVFRAYDDAIFFLLQVLNAKTETHWTYEDANGSPRMIVVRFDLQDKTKTYRPLHKSSGGWMIGDPPGPLPLYRLPKLAGASRVFVTEGEKCAKLVGDLGVVSTTPAHGAQSPHRTDWSPLAGKEVIVLPDNDPAGESFARAVLRLLALVDPRPHVKVVRLADLWQSDSTIPEGGDAAEWLSDGVPDGWTEAECRAALVRGADAAAEVDVETSASVDKDGTQEPNSSPLPKLSPGKWVKAYDRQPPNYGRVVEDLGDSAVVHFVSPQGFKADATLQKKILRNTDGSDLTDVDPKEWPPLQFQEPPRVLTFPLEVFPASLQAYAREVASSTLTPLDFVGAAMLTTAGAAIGQSVNIKLKRRWPEPPLLFMILVASPGKTKTPVIRTVTQPLANIDVRLRQESQELLNEWKKAVKAKKKDESDDDPGPPPPGRRAVVKDITRESLVLVLEVNPHGVLCDPDEAAAWLGSFNQYKVKGNDRQFWLSIWSCTAISVDRKGGNESRHVQHPFAAVIGGMPPDILTMCRGENGPNDGLLDRILFSFPEDFPPQRWTELELSEDSENAWLDAINRLHAKPMQIDDDGVERPRLISLSAEAMPAWIDWFNSHSDETEEMPVRQEGSLSKMKSHAARFALILSQLRRACDQYPDDAVPLPEVTADTGESAGGQLDLYVHVGINPDGQVDLIDVQGAIKLAEYFKSHLQRIVHHMSGGLGNSDAKPVVDWIRRKGSATFREAEVGEDLRRFRKNADLLKSVLKSLVEAGAIRPSSEPMDPHKRGPKPSPAYEVHPDLLSAPEISSNSANDGDHQGPGTNDGITGNSWHPEAQHGGPADQVTD